MTIGEKIKLLRGQQGQIGYISREKVGFKVWPSQTEDAVRGKMKRIENNTRKVAAVELPRFANYFDVSIYYLLGLTEIEEMNDVRKRLKEKTFPGIEKKAI